MIPSFEDIINYDDDMYMYILLKVRSIEQVHCGRKYDMVSQTIHLSRSLSIELLYKNCWNVGQLVYC